MHVISKGQVVYSARPEELRANEQIKASYLGIYVPGRAEGAIRDRSGLRIRNGPGSAARHCAPHCARDTRS